MSKKYGLIIPKQKTKLITGGSDKKPSVFKQSDESSGDDESSDKRSSRMITCSSSVSKQQEAKVKRHVQNQIAKALEEDPTVFEYDQVFDEMERKKAETFQRKNAADKKREPKYVKQLLKAAEKRQHEYESREERKQLKEREKEHDEFKDKETFVTGAYRKKMEELEAYKQEERRKEYLESVMDVTKQKDIAGFYKHFLNDMTSSSTEMTSSAKEMTSSMTGSIDRSATSSIKIKKEIDADADTVSETKVNAGTAADADTRTMEDMNPDADTDMEDSDTDSEPEWEQKSVVKTKKQLPPARRYRARERSGTPVVDEKDDGDFNHDETAKKRRTLTESSSENDFSEKSIDKSEQKMDTKRTDIENVNKKRHLNSDRSGAAEKQINSVVPKLTEREQKELKIKQRLDALRRLLARRNNDDVIEAYRRRYFERRALLEGQS